jgi:hypothetical protein
LILRDSDPRQFFDRVNHDGLMARVAARVSDKRVLKLIRAFLVIANVEHLLDDLLLGPMEKTRLLAFGDKQPQLLG